MYVVKVPYVNPYNKKENISYRTAGNKILEKLNELGANEQGKPLNTMLLDLEEIHVDNSNLAEANKLIFKNSLETFEEKPKTIFLGGDHSISYSLGKAFLQYCKNENKEPCLVVFDSKIDLKESENKDVPTNEEWLKSLIESGFPSENILIVGARNINFKEIKILKEKNIKTISLNMFLEDFRDACDVVMEFASGKELYLSIDLGIVDPAFVSKENALEPGGLTSRELIYLVQKMSKIKSLKAVDIAEVDQNNGLSVSLGAKILGEFL